MNTSLIRRALVAVATATLTTLPAQIAGADSGAEGQLPLGVLAEFDGTTMNLAEGWGQARACSVTDEGTTCYRSEREMDQALAASARVQLDVDGDLSVLGTCASSLRLYDGTSWGGQVVSFTTTGSLITLSGYGFDNKTSSYRVGACGSILYSGIGSGSYPGNTSANAQSASMLSGWDNTISSVLIP